MCTNGCGEVGNRGKKMQDMSSPNLDFVKEFSLIYQTFKLIK